VGATAVIGLAGCGVGTGIDVAVRPDGSGTVGVTVSVDREAQAQIGDLAGQLQSADLAQAGWAVSGPVAGLDGAQTVTATKAFKQPSEVGADMASLAGSGPPASRPFRLTLSRRTGLFHTATTLRGTIDLTCGVSCFGDEALRRQLGSSVGVDPGAVADQAAANGASPGAANGASPGAAAAQTLSFAFMVHLPGPARASGGATVQGGTVIWRPVLGRRLALSASSESFNRGTADVVAGAGVVVMVATVVAVIVVVRRRFRS